MFIILLASVNALLLRYTGQEDIVVGSPLSGRQHKSLENQVGYYVNTLALRTAFKGSEVFEELVVRVKETVLAAFEHEIYPFDQLVEDLELERDTSRSPFFDVMVALNPEIGVDLIGGLQGITIESYELNSKISKFDLLFMFFESNKTINGIIEFNTDLFSRNRIERLCAHYVKLLETIVSSSQSPLNTLDYLSIEEKNQLLVEFNDTHRDYPHDKMIDELFKEQVEKTPDKIATAGCTLETNLNMANLSYLELDRISDCLADELKTRDIGYGDITGIMLERSLEMIIAVLAVVKVGGAYLPIALQYPGKRIHFMLADSSAKILLTTKKIPGKVNVDKPREIAYVEDIETNTGTGQYSYDSPAFGRRSGSLAYIIYTSGSTGSPKGVIVEHRHVIRLVKNTNYIDFNPDDRILQTGALEFDASTFEIWGALLNGLLLYLVDKDDILVPEKLKRTITDNQITTMWLTSPLFNQMVQSDMEIFAGLRNLLVGGDILSPPHINQVRKRFPHLKITNGYGPTENTTFSTTFLIDKEYEANIPIGKPIANSTAYVVDGSGNLQPIGIAGELWVGGDGTARGYLNNPELTFEKFINYKLQITNKKGPFKRDYRSHMSYMSHIYKTGDQARWLADGNIEFLGRIDQQVKIRGFRVEPGEIENRLLGHQNINEAVVLVKNDKKGDKYLCAYIVSAGPVEGAELKRFLSPGLPDYMIPSFFVFLEQIPLTPNGKVDWRRLPEPEVVKKSRCLAPRDEFEDTLAAIWGDVLGIEKELVSIDADFFESGGHSLKATQLVSKIHRAFNVNVPLTEIFINSTLMELASYLKEAAKDKYVSIEPAEEKEYYAVSSAQKRLYVLRQMDGAGIAYNLPSVVIVEGVPDKDKLQEVFSTLIHRHESLRTSFHMAVGEPVQRVHEEAAFEIEYPGAGDRAQYAEPEEECQAPYVMRCASVVKNFIRPFDLSRAPLLRVGLAGLDTAKHLLVVDMHHIISDGVSMGIFIKEFTRFYAGENLSEPHIRYKDFSEWQNSNKQKSVIKQQEQYWLREFAGEIPVLDLPTDFNRPPIQGFAGNTLTFEINDEETHALKLLAHEQNATLFITLLSIYSVFLSRLCGQEDIIVGAPIAGRRHADLEQIIGMFVNTLALRNSQSGEKTYSEFLSQVQEKTLKAFENQDYLFEDMVEKIEVQRDVSRNPLFDVMFAFQNMFNPAADLMETRMAGLQVTPYDYENLLQTSKFDLNLTAIESRKKLIFTFEYCTKLFRENTIVRFITYFRTIVSSILEKPGMKLSEIEIITGEEKKQLLFDFNAAQPGYANNKTIQELFEEEVVRTADRIALVGGTGQSREKGYISLSYKELNKESDQLAQVLLEKGVKPGTIVAIMVQRSIEMVIGILGILKAGGAYLPIDPGSPQKRINYMLVDSSAKVLLAAPDIQVKTEAEVKKESIERIDISNLLSFSTLTTTSTCQVSPANLAYVIYTSGSTGKPKGVLVEHRSAVNILTAMQREYPGNESDTYLLKTSYVFDVSVTELFGWFLGCGRLVILEKNGEKDPGKIIDTIEQFMITHINFVPSMFNVFIDQLNLHPRDISKLPGLKYIFLAGETLLPGLVNKFTGLVIHRYIHTPVRLENIYGPTEGTIYTSKYSLSGWKGSGSIPIGKPMENTRLYIVDKYNRLQPVGVPGELCIGGVGVARGYLNQPQLTAEKFCLSSYFTFYPSLLYKTGDLARWLSDGNIEFLGRQDSQVKIRGFRIELCEIESRLLSHSSVKETVVIARENKSSENILFAYIVGDKAAIVAPFPNDTELRQHLLETLPDYMIPSYFLQLDEIPLNPSGKVNRKELPAPEIQRGKNYAAPSDDMERKLAAMWAEVLEIEKDVIGIETNFFELGGHSLKATGLLSRIHREFNVHIPLNVIFKTPFIRGLAKFIKDAARHILLSIEPAELKEYYPLSSVQERLYFLQQMDLECTAYNMPSVFILTGELNRELSEQVLCRLVRRHESLRTSFETVKEEAVQRIHHEVAFSIDYYQEPVDLDWSLGIGDDNREKEAVSRLKAVEVLTGDFIRPFALSRAPLLRVRLIKTGDAAHILMVDMHHIISDGTSINVLIKDFTGLYKGDTPFPGIRITYKDFSQWQTRPAQKKLLELQESYWLKEFAGEIPVLNLPTDYSRPLVQSFEGGAIYFELDEETSCALKSLSREQDVTLFMLLLSIYNVFLSKLSGQEDIVAGSPIAGRRHAELESLIGMFVNTLALRNFPMGAKPFTVFLSELKKRTLEAFENRDYPYENLVERVAVERDAGRNPLFDTMFALQNFVTPVIEIPGLKLKPYQYESRISKFDLLLQCSENEDQLVFTFEYSKKLFAPTTIERFINYFKKIISLIIENSGRKLLEIEIISESEKRKILDEFNHTSVEYPKDKRIDELFEEQAAQVPDHIALVGVSVGGSRPVSNWASVTYKELNRKSNQLAYVLVEKGVKPDTIVGIMVERSLEMILGLLAILKAGGAYLPIDPASPGERLQYMLNESGTNILLTTMNILGDAHFDNDKEIVYIEENVLEQTWLTYKPAPTAAASLAYVIYTSGSTGNPKGVMVTHRNICPLLHWGYDDFGLSPNDRTIQNLSYFFDWSAWEIFITLTSGAGLYIPHAGVILDPAAVVDFIKSHAVTVLHITPTQFQYLLGVEEDLNTLDYLFIGAEKLTYNVVQQGYDRVRQDCRVFNMYGPTEAAIISASLEMQRGGEMSYGRLSSIPIGTPSANANLLILDKYMNWCPVNVTGELYIAGDGVARGYFNQPGLTAEKFYLRRPGTLLAHHPSTLYKTGDLSRWLPDGNVEFLGRIDHQVKVRGFRIEPGEIENQLSRLTGIKEAIVLAHSNEKSAKYLCAYLVFDSETQFEIPGLRKSLARNLPDYMIPSYFIQLDEIPLNPNGKVDRKALPVPGIQVGENYTAPRHDIERKLVKIWSYVLEIEKDIIGIDASFFELGGHSLKLVELVSHIHKEFNVQISLKDIFTTPTIRELATIVSGKRPSIHMTIETAEEKEFYELSYNQKRLWEFGKSHPQDISYNIPGGIPLSTSINEKIIKKALFMVIKKHESLRTSFIEINNQPFQVIAKTVDVPLQSIDLSPLEANKKQQERERIFSETSRTLFDLSRPPLFRCMLVNLGEGQYDLMFNLHHIISDGWSFELLRKDLISLVEAGPSGQDIEPEPLNVQYKDFAAWQNQQLTNPTVTQEPHRYWVNKFNAGLPGLRLPFDFTAAAPTSDNSGIAYRSVIESETQKKLHELAGNYNTSLFTVLFSAFNLLMARICRQEEIVCRLPTAGRNHLLIHPIVGYFISPIFVKNRVVKKDEENFVDFLQRVNENTMEAFNYQWYPLELVFEELQLKYPDPGATVSFNMLNMVENTAMTELTNFDSFHLEQIIEEKFPLTIQLLEHKNGIEILWRYKKRLFKAGTIERTAALYKELLHEIAK